MYLFIYHAGLDILNKCKVLVENLHVCVTIFETCFH